MGIALFLGLTMLAAWIGSAIPRNGDWRQPEQGIELMLETNGFHTAIVMPVTTPQKDWRETFPIAPEATHVSIGWGDEDVFLHTPTWWDLKPFTVLELATVGGSGIVRVSPYVRPAPSEWHRPFRVTPGQYARLVRHIESTLAPLPPGGAREVLRDSYSTDAYYRARGRFGLTRPCNQWVSDALAEAGIRTGWWTPFASGVSQWVPPPGERTPG